MLFIIKVIPVIWKREEYIRMVYTHFISRELNFY